MIFDESGYPRDTGATDFQDSARLIGMMATFGITCIDWVMIAAYVKRKDEYVRHPKEGNKYKFSRDQAVPLFAGLFLHKLALVNKDYNPPNGDWISPSVRGHFVRCSGGKANWFQNLWLWFDVLWSCYVDNFITTEVNQLVCMLMLHPNEKYIRFWRSHHPNWDSAIMYYWCGWRGENDLARTMIKTIREV